MGSSVTIQRLYECPAAGSGYRVFVDRLWPRGLSKSSFTFDLWAKDLAPSAELRRWFGHKEENWPGFREKYRKELHAQPQQQAMASLLDQAGPQDIVLLYGARDTRHNQAVVLADELEKLRQARAGNG